MESWMNLIFNFCHSKADFSLPASLWLYIQSSCIILPFAKIHLVISRKLSLVVMASIKAGIHVLIFQCVGIWVKEYGVCSH